MSFLDRLKSFFSGGGDDRAGHAHDEPHGGESNLEASAGLPPTPVDRLGSPAPEAAPEPVAPEAAPEPIAPPPPPSDPDRL